MTKPNDPRQQWRELVELGASADLDGVEDMSEDELDAALAKAGADVQALNAQAKAEHDASVGPRAKPATAPRPVSRPVSRAVWRPTAWLAAPAAAIVATGSALLLGESLVMVGSGYDEAGAGRADARADAGPEGGADAAKASEP